MNWKRHQPDPALPDVVDTTGGIDPVRVSLASMIGLRHAARSLPLKAAKIRAKRSGGFLSPFKGRGMEFDEVRLYQPGDDIRSFDWKVTARTGKPHTKLFRDERERPILLWVDLRAPMFFATRGMYKAVAAARAAALLAWSAVLQGDRLGALIFSEYKHVELRPQRGSTAALHFMKQLVEHPAWTDRTQATIGDRHASLHALGRLRRVARPGSLIFLISDFRNIDDVAESHISQMARHNDIDMVFMFDPLERELPPAGIYRVSNEQETLTLNTRDENVRETYRQRFDAHWERWRRRSRLSGMYLMSCSTEQNVLHALQRGFGSRGA
ncbi:MAG TPA: DUF58 domain-containing protein [Nitrospirales bacterium]|nr:DUF58 domain-containing protein [Nitrospirales bacterium]HIN33569.1 DUF58 domain-containing protein [Nitrospirales bacterium]